MIDEAKGELLHLLHESVQGFIALAERGSHRTVVNREHRGQPEDRLQPPAKFKALNLQPIFIYHHNYEGRGDEVGRTESWNNSGGFTSTLSFLYKGLTSSRLVRSA